MLIRQPCMGNGWFLVCRNSSECHPDKFHRKQYETTDSVSGPLDVLFQGVQVGGGPFRAIKGQGLTRCRPQSATLAPGRWHRPVAVTRLRAGDSKRTPPQ